MVDSKVMDSFCDPCAAYYHASECVNTLLRVRHWMSVNMYEIEKELADLSKGA